MTYDPPVWFPDPYLSPMSRNDYTDKLHRLQSYVTAIDKLMWLPSSQMTVVPYQLTDRGANCSVVDPGPESANQRSYPVGGYHVWVGDRELETAVDLSQYLFTTGKIPHWSWAVRVSDEIPAFIDGSVAADRIRADVIKNGDELGLALLFWN